MPSRAAVRRRSDLVGLLGPALALAAGDGVVGEQRLDERPAMCRDEMPERLIVDFDLLAGRVVEVAEHVDGIGVALLI